MTAAALTVWHATILEITWTLIGLVGMWVCNGNLSSSKDGLVSLRVMNGHTIERFNELRVIAAGQWRNDLFRMVMSLVIVSVGVIACISPPASQNPKTITPVAIALTFGLFIIEIVIVVSSIMDKVMRDFLYDAKDHY
jgi:hypothetical protein